FFFVACDAATSHRRHHHTQPLGAPVPLEPPHFPLRFQTRPSLDPQSCCRKQPRNEAVLTVFQQTFGLSFSLISPPNLTSNNVSLECYKHYPMYLPIFETWIRKLEILGNVGTGASLTDVAVDP
ncbi:ZWICHEL kinesin-like calmodulin-binding protein, partial [Prunus dulcis]